jgi:hypothetical protein
MVHQIAERKAAPPMRQTRPAPAGASNLTGDGMGIAAREEEAFQRWRDLFEAMPDTRKDAIRTRRRLQIAALLGDDDDDDGQRPHGEVKDKDGPIDIACGTVPSAPIAATVGP